jgi:hypothetical protein
VVEPAIVPYVTTRRVAEARALIDAAAPARGNVEPRPASGPPGIVRDQPPAAGTEMARIAPLLVPAVIGRDITEAGVLIAGAGWTVGSIIERPFFLPPFLRPAGTVFEQQPAAGTVLAAPVLVNLVVLESIPAWAMVVPLTALGTAIGFLVRRQRPDRLRRPRPLPGVTTQVSRDPGDQRITSPVRPVTMEIRVRPVVDRGRQSVKAPPPRSDRAGVDAPRHS